jgi:hypothetical protein
MATGVGVPFIGSGRARRGGTEEAGGRQWWGFSSRTCRGVKGGGESTGAELVRESEGSQAALWLHLSAAGRPSVARDATAWPDGQQWLGCPEKGERPRVGRCGAAKAGWAGVLWWAKMSRWAIIVD